jgi:hypothetical protein
MTHRPAAYRFSPVKLLHLIARLGNQQQLSDHEAQQFLGLKLLAGYRRYKSFLLQGSLLENQPEHTVATPQLQQIWSALQQGNYHPLQQGLLKISSFQRLHDFIKQREQVHYYFEKGKMRLDSGEAAPIAAVAIENYLALGEAVGLWLVCPAELKSANQADWKTIWFCSYEPSAVEFAVQALQQYSELRQREQTSWILTGRWLEHLTAKAKIHPLVAKRLVPVINKQRLLQVYVDGSTPDTRFDQHTMWMMQVQEGRPSLVKRFLYHGDFLIPGLASVRIKLQEVQHAP